MTDEEIERLAIKVADLVFISLLEKQKEWDQQFTTDVNEMFGGSYISAAGRRATTIS
jgi:hypothetical protein